MHQSQQRSNRTKLEGRIAKITTRDAVLFHDLRNLRLYAEGPKWMKRLDFPDLLLNQKRSWKEYDSQKLSPEHHLFATLRLFIQSIKEELAFVKLPGDIQDALKRVRGCYQRYIEECCVTKGEERRSTLTGPARLTGWLEGKFVCKELPQQRARQLLSINRYNENVRTNECGASAVAQYGGVFFKRAMINSLRPGNEQIVDLFNQLFLGGRATPTTLLNFKNIYVEDLNGEKIQEHPLRKQLLTQWVCHRQPPLYSAFVSQQPNAQEHPFEEKKESFSIQASLEVEGTRLDQFLIHNPNANLREVMNRYNFQAMALLSLILRVDDGRGDNYFIERAGQLGREVVGIDNDGILAPPVVNYRDGHKIQLRSILFLFPQLMDRPLDEELVAHLTSLNIEEIFISYLAGLDRYNRSPPIQALSESELKELSLPISLSLPTLLGIYDALKKVQKRVREDPQSTMDDLFALLFPIVHRAYKKLLQDNPSTPLEIQEKIFSNGNAIESPTIVNIEELLEMSPEEVEASLRNLPGMPADSPPLPISELLPLFIDSIFHQLNRDQQWELLKHTHTLFQDFDKTHFKGSKLSDAQFAEILERKKSAELFLEEAEAIDPAGLITLMHDFPEVKIILGRNRNFDVNGISKLIRKAQKMQRPLYCKIHGKEYSLFEQDLRNVIEPAIEYSHFALAAALIQNYSFQLDVMNAEGNTFLHQMAKRGTPDSLRFLIQTCGFSITAVNSRGLTPFHIAADEGNVNTLQTLIYLEGQGVQDVSGLAKKDPDGQIPFHYAMSKDRNEAIVFLLHEIFIHRLPGGEWVHLESAADGYNLLHMAAKFGMADEIPSLIETYRMDVNARGRCQRTPLHMAAHNGQVEAARNLIERGADVNARANKEDSETTPLHEAVSRGHVAVVELLLQSEGIDINLRNQWGLTPTDIAVLDRNEPITQMLIN